MKQYRYTAAELGLDKLPPGELRLTGFEVTTDPTQADVFVIPPDIRHVSNETILGLPYLAGAADRHVCFCISDRPKRCLGLPLISFRADCNKGIMRGDPSTISWPWPVNPQRDIDPWIPLPETGFCYDVTFVGWNSTALTAKSCAAVKESPYLKSFIELNSTFYGTWESANDVEKITHYRRLMLARMNESRLSLCARSIAEGVVRYRFYEALAMGRVPVHLNDNAWLPFQSKIDWDKCSLNVPENRVDQLGTILRNWLDRHSDAEIIERGKYGREMWETWLDGAKWDSTFAYCVTERLAGRM